MTADASPAFRGLTPMLRTRDLDAAIAFYLDRLGFALQRRSDADGWASLRRDGIELMLSAFNAHEGDEATPFTGSLYLRCDDVDAWWDRLRDIAPVCYPIENFDYGMREFAVRDPNGFLLQFGQPTDDPPDTHER